MNAIVTNATDTQCVDATVLMGSAVAVVKTYLQSNSVPHDQLPGLLREVYAAMAESIGAPASTPGAAAEMGAQAAPLSTSTVNEAVAAGKASAPKKRKPTKAEAEKEAAERKEAERKLRISRLSTDPVVPVNESVLDDGLICLLDGEKKLMLKRHLRARYGMEWDEYVSHFGLGSDYPSVAPGYSEIKRREAVRQGLGSLIDKTPRHLRDMKPEEAEPAKAVVRKRRRVKVDATLVA